MDKPSFTPRSTYSTRQYKVLRQRRLFTDSPTPESNLNYCYSTALYGPETPASETSNVDVGDTPIQEQPLDLRVPSRKLLNESQCPPWCTYSTTYDPSSAPTYLPFYQPSYPPSFPLNYEHNFALNYPVNLQSNYASSYQPLFLPPICPPTYLSISNTIYNPLYQAATEPERSASESERADLNTSLVQRVKRPF